MGRAPCCDKANVKKGPWSPEEDAKLKDYITQHGTGGNWIALPRKAGLRRCGKSCRLRWLNYLRPNIKHGEFSDEEDKIICTLYATIGSRWSIIAAQLPGRTDNDIKNYWNTKLKKKLLMGSHHLAPLFSHQRLKQDHGIVTGFSSSPSPSSYALSPDPPSNNYYITRPRSFTVLEPSISFSYSPLPSDHLLRTHNAVQESFFGSMKQYHERSSCSSSDGSSNNTTTNNNGSTQIVNLGKGRDYAHDPVMGLHASLYSGYEDNQKLVLDSTKFDGTDPMWGAHDQSSSADGYAGLEEIKQLISTSNCSYNDDNSFFLYENNGEGGGGFMMYY